MVLEETGLCCQLICLKDASAYHQSNTNLRALIVFKDNVRGHLEAANRSNNGTFSKVLLQANTFISFIAQVMQWPPAIYSQLYKEGEVKVSTCPLSYLLFICFLMQLNVWPLHDLTNSKIKIIRCTQSWLWINCSFH